MLSWTIFIGRELHLKKKLLLDASRNASRNSRLQAINLPRTPNVAKSQACFLFKLACGKVFV